MYIVQFRAVNGDVIELAAIHGGMALVILADEEAKKADGLEFVRLGISTSDTKQLLRCLHYNNVFISKNRDIKISKSKDSSIHIHKIDDTLRVPYISWILDQESSQGFIRFLKFTIDRQLPSDLVFLQKEIDEQVQMQIAEGIAFSRLMETPKYWDRLGIRIGMAGDLKLANRCFQKALSIDSCHYTSTLNLAVNLGIENKLEEALEMILQTPEGHPRRNVILANTLCDLDREDEAVAYYERAIEEEPDFYLPYVRLLNILNSTDSPAYEYWLEQAVQHAYLSPYTGVSYVRHLLDQGKIVELAFLDWVDQLQPVNQHLSVIGQIDEEPYFIAEAKLARLVAQVYLNADKQDLQEAVETLQTLPDNYNVCTYAKLLVSAAAQLGLPELVTKSYQKVCPDCITSGLGVSRHLETVLSDAYAKCEKPEEAIALCEKVLREDPNDLQTLSSYWSHLDDLGCLDEAISIAERVSVIDPEQQHIFYNLGYLCAKKGLFGKAQYYYKKQIEIDPQHYMAIENLVIIELMQNRIDSAKNRFADYCQMFRLVAGSPSEDWHALADILNDPELESAQQEEKLEYLAEDIQMKTAKFNHLVDFCRTIQDSPIFALKIQLENHADEPILGAYTGIEHNPFSMEKILSTLRQVDEAQLAEVRFQLEQQTKGDFSALLSSLITELPVFQQLPSEAQSSLSEGEKRLREINAGDFSLAVVAFSKAVEVALRKVVLDPFREKYQYAIEIEHETNIKIIGKQRGAEKFIQFVEKGFFIGLGEMAIALNLCNQPTSLQAPCIGKLRAFIFDQLKFQLLLDPKTIESIAELAKNYRNKAAHSAVLDRDAALAARTLAIGILSSFQQSLG